MKKRFLSIMLVLLMLAGIPASAESLFTLPSMEKAVSYGVQMGAEPVSETTLEDGSLVQVYGNVTNDAFSQFGVILNKMGYSLASQNTVDGVFAASVVKGDISFVIEYDLAAGLLGIQYPAGLGIEKSEIPDPFEGYIPLKFGESVRIKNPSTGENWGDVTIDDFVSTDKEFLSIESKDKFGNYKGRFQNGIFILGTFKNVSTGEIEAHQLFNATLHYINTDNHYQYSTADNSPKDGRKIALDIGIFIDKDRVLLYNYDGSYEPNIFNNNQPVPVFMTSDGSSDKFSSPKISSMDTKDIAARVDNVPSQVINAADGILAVTFKFAGIDTPYVLYIRK